MQWCQLTMNGLGHPQPAVANEFITRERQNIIPEWYRRLTRAARDHVTAGNEPVLALAPKPDLKAWKAHQRVIDEWLNTVDTFGLEENE